jgi:hypothetical protein
MKVPSTVNFSFISDSTAWGRFFVTFFTQTVGLFGRVTSPPQRRYLHTGQHKCRINAYTDIHALNGIRTHDPSGGGSLYANKF